MSIRGAVLAAFLSTFAWTSPAAAQAPQITSFTAMVSDENLVTLSFAGSNTNSLVFIKDFREPTQLPNSGFVPPVGTVSFRARAGRNRFTFIATSPSGQQVFRDLEIDVPFPAAPLVVGPAFTEVDVVAPVPVQLRWAPRPEGFFRLRRVEDFLDLAIPGAPPERPNDAFTDRFDVPVAQPGEELRSFALRFCKDKPATPTVVDPPAYCSESVIYTVQTRPARFTGRARRVVPAGSATLSWTAPVAGRLFILCQRILGGADACESFGQGGLGTIVASTSSFTVSGLQPGLHEFQLETCTPGSGSTLEEIIANADCRRPLNSTQQLIVAPPTQWQIDRPITDDFTVSVFDARGVVGGKPLDILIDSTDRIYVQSEFTRGLQRVRTDVGATPFFSGETESFAFPLRLRFEQTPSSTVLRTVRPFGLFNDTDTSNTSALGEKVLETTSADGRRFIWSTQGGRFSDRPFLGTTRARILRFEPGASDDPRTPDDERFCAFTAPGNDNRVIGLASDGQRMYYTEAPFDGPPAVVSFDPAQLQCENQFDFDLPGAVSTHRTCLPGESVGCFKKVPLLPGPGSPTGATSFVGHVAVDPVDGKLWVVGSAGLDALFRVDPTTGVSTRFPLPRGFGPSTRNQGSGPGNFVFDRKLNPPPTGLGSRPLAFIGPIGFQIRVTADHVFVGEFADNDIVRLRKSSISTACQSLNGRINPCMDEVHVPARSNFSLLHSIELFQNKLFFTLTDETSSAIHPDLSTLGYITTDLQSGVVYGPIARADDGRNTGPASFHGLSIDPDDGTVALADFRQQVVRLTRRP